VDDFEKIFVGLNKQRPGGLYVPGGEPLKFELVINLMTAKQIGLRFRRTCWRERIG
jgi:hypothetical protein